MTRSLPETFYFHVLFLLTLHAGEPCRMGKGELGLWQTTSGRFSGGLRYYLLQPHRHTVRHCCFSSPSSSAGAILSRNLVKQFGGWGLINTPKSNLELVKAPEQEQDTLLLLCLVGWVDSCDNTDYLKLVKNTFKHFAEPVRTLMCWGERLLVPFLFTAVACSSLTDLEQWLVMCSQNTEAYIAF